MTQSGRDSVTLTPAQQRVLDFLRADDSGDFIIVPAGITSGIRPIEKLLELGLIETEQRNVPLPPGCVESFYRAVRAPERDPRGVGNGPVAGRFVLLADYEGETGYVTSWDTWEEAEAAFPIPDDLVLLDPETRREWFPGSPHEWEAART